MELVVTKFGGSSLATSASILRCANIVLERPKALLVVLSASGKTTNKLVSAAKFAANGDAENVDKVLQEIIGHHIQVANELHLDKNGLTLLEELFEEAKRLAKGMCLLNEASAKAYDQLLSVGERLSSLLFQQALKELGDQAEIIDARKIIKTSENFNEAEPLIEKIAEESKKLILPKLERGIRLITQGFIGSTLSGQTTTLGRGGSDYTAALVGEAIRASHIEIWTDVPGMATADPRIVSDAKSIEEISFSEAAELATFGAKILHPSTLWPAIRNNISVYIGSSIKPEAKGTWIRKQVDHLPDVRAISIRREQVLLTLDSLSMLRRPGFLARVFLTLAEEGISVDLVTTSEVRVSLTIDEPSKLSEKALSELKKFAHIEVEKDLALVAIVGNRASTTPGIAKKALETMDENIRLICHGASPHNLCFLVEDSVCIETIRRLHKEFIQGSA